jgi:hypothetical protein
VAVAVPFFINLTTLYGEVSVLDQYSRGVIGVVVTFDLNDTNGHISCSNYTTDVYGKVYFEYTIGDNPEQVILAYVNSTYFHRSVDYIFGRCFFYNKRYTITANSNLRLISNLISQYVIDMRREDLEYFEDINIKDSNTICDNYIECPVSPVEGSSKCNNTVDYLDTSSTFICDANINGDGMSELYTAITAYTNGSISTSTIVDIFLFLSYFKPNPFSDRNTIDSIIDFYIYPSSYSLDIDTLHVNVLEINNDINYVSGWMDIVNDGSLTLIDIGGKYAIRFTYSKPTDYYYNSTIYCIITIYDKAPIPNKYRYECYFKIIPDYKKPTVVATSPECDSYGVDKDVDICVIIDDEGSGVDINTIHMYVDGIPVYFTVYTVGNGIAIMYNNNLGFFPGSFVTYTIVAADNEGNKLRKSCMFNVKGSNAPEIVVEPICGGVVDNRFSFYFDVFDKGSGVKYDEVELILHNKLAQFTSKPILYRIK